MRASKCEYAGVIDLNGAIWVAVVGVRVCARACVAVSCNIMLLHATRMDHGSSSAAAARAAVGLLHRPIPVPDRQPSAKSSRPPNACHASHLFIFILFYFIYISFIAMIQRDGGHAYPVGMWLLPGEGFDASDTEGWTKGCEGAIPSV